MERKEKALTVVEITSKTLLSVIPIGGALYSNVWDSIKEHSAQKRIDEWKNLVEERLHKIEKELEDIGKNELFTSAMISATEIALKTAAENKREYLANVVMNSLEIPIEESKLMIMLDLIDHLTAWHLSVLLFFKDPTEGGRYSTASCDVGTPYMALKNAHPELTEDLNMVNKIIRDLQADGLLVPDNFIDVTMPSAGMLSPRITNFGGEFLNYIMKPTQE